MFTGIVEERGGVEEIRTQSPARLTVACRTVLADTAVGDSVNVDGCCLTVTAVDVGDDGAPRAFTADVMGETLARTSLGDRRSGDEVNLERAVRADARLGGHLVQGHVDGVGVVRDVTAHPSPEGADDWALMWVSVPEELSPYLVEKGSVAVDGTSLTVAAVDGAAFAVGLIAHTRHATTLGARRPGDRCNIEADVVAKYVERLLAARPESPYLTQEPRG